jgi:hypothetical protein
MSSDSAGQRWRRFQFKDGKFIVTVTTTNPQALDNLKRCHPGTVITITDLSPHEATA